MLAPVFDLFFLLTVPALTFLFGQSRRLLDEARLRLQTQSTEGGAH